MRNPYVVQYLESLRHADGTFVCEPSAYQQLVPAFPANTKIQSSIAPGAGYYASIGFGATFSYSMVPNAFQMTIVQWGTQPFTGILTDNIIHEGVEYIAVVTQFQPYNAYINNITNFPQFLCITGYFLNVLKDDYNEVITRLEQLGTYDAVNILKAMQAGIGPKPPLGGS